MGWDKNKYFKTQDRQLVAYLALNNINFIGVEDSLCEGHVQITFVYTKTNDMLKLYGQFGRGEARVEPRAFGKLLRNVNKEITERKWGTGHNTAVPVLNSSVMGEQDGDREKT